MKKAEIEKILLTVNPHIKKHINKKTNLINDGIIDSFDIVEFLALIEKKKEKKINIGKISRESFRNLDTITAFINKL